MREMRRRSAVSGLGGGELDDLAHQAAHDAMLAVLAKLPRFRGESRFTTWAYQFAALEVTSTIGRHRTSARRLLGWEPGDWEQLPDQLGVDPHEHAEYVDMLSAVRRAMNQTLSSRQRSLFAAVVLEGTPPDVLVAQFGTSRNAVYKSVFDARRKIRAFLVANGYLDRAARSACCRRR